MQPVVVAGLHSSSLRRTSRRILTTDRNDGRWQVEARRGHRPHERGRRRVRCPTGRTGGRWRVTMWSPCRLRRRRFTPPSPACPEHPAVSNATDVYCAPRITSLRSERTKSLWHLKQLDTRAFARRGNCALGTQAPNPRAPPNTAPHLPSAGVVVVGLAASPAASAPIGIAAPPAAGAKGRQRKSKARRGLDSFPTRKWTEVTMQVTKLLDAKSFDLRRVLSIVLSGTPGYYRLQRRSEQRTMCASRPRTTHNLQTGDAPQNVSADCLP